jgi:hypothetical protein
MDLEALVQLMQHEKVTLNMNLKTSVSLHFPILNKNSLPTSHTYLSIFQVYNGHFFTRFIFVQNEKKCWITLPNYRGMFNNSLFRT